MEIKDKNGRPIKTGDLVNVYFTTSNGEYIHDCVYKAITGPLGDLRFKFVGLLWISGGLNQYPCQTTLCEEYKSLSYEYDGNELKLKVPDNWDENHFHNRRWKTTDKSFYFEVIDSYENPDP